MEDDSPCQQRRISTRTRKVASRMVTALASLDNRTQAALARLEALESDNAGTEAVDLNEDDDASLDDDDDDVGYLQKRQSKGTKRKTRQAKTLETARKAPKTFLELLQEVLVNTILAVDFTLRSSLRLVHSQTQANLDALPPHVPSYLRAAVGTPGSTSRRHYCTVCGFTASYTCVRCGVRFCSIRCQNIHNDTRCLKFVA